MKELLIYQLEVACCLTFFYLFYKVVLRKETDFQLKRLFIIISSLVAFVLPALNIQYSLNSGPTSIPLEYLTMIPTQIIAYSPSSAPTNEVNLWWVLSVIWGIGLLAMLLRLLQSLYHVNRIVKDATKEQEGEIFKITNTNVQSFSFFKTIVLNTRHYHSKAMKYILAHEQAHSDQYHSVDVLFVELLKAFQWFNPIAWLFAKESIQNLEYLADKEVVTSMKNMRDYQMAIVQFAHHSGNKLLRTEFSKSNLKNRIIMMNQPNNQKIHVGKFILILPVFVVLFMSFSIKIENLDLKNEVSELLPIFNIPELNINESINLPSIKKLEIENSSASFTIANIDTVNSSSNEVFTIVEDQPYPSTGDIESYYEKIHADLTYPTEAKEKDIKGKVFVQFIVQKDGTLRSVQAVKGIGYGCDEEAVRVIKNGPLWVPGKEKGKSVDVKMILPVSFGISKPQSQNTERRVIKGIVINEDGNPLIGANVVIKGTSIGTVSDTEGRFIIKTEQEHKELIFASKDMISQSVLISDKEEYKIVLKTEDGYQADPKSNNSGISISASGKELMFEKDEPMFILNGEEIAQEDFNQIQPDDIESITVLKDHTAIEEYGEDAKNGVIIINTKNGLKVAQNYNSIDTKDNSYFTTSTSKLKALRNKKNENLIDNMDNPPLIIKDGVEITVKEYKKIKRNSIESISVIKGNSATEIYGEKGDNGVILIKMKE